MSGGPHIDIEIGTIWVSHGGLLGIDEPVLNVFVNDPDARELVPVPLSKIREAVDESIAPQFFVQWWPRGAAMPGPKEWKALEDRVKAAETLAAKCRDAATDILDDNYVTDRARRIRAECRLFLNAEESHGND